MEYSRHLAIHSTTNASVTHGNLEDSIRFASYKTVLTLSSVVKGINFVIFGVGQIVQVTIEGNAHNNFVFVHAKLVHVINRKVDIEILEV